MAVQAKCTCKIEFQNHRLLETVLNALKPEIQKPPTYRSRSEIMIDGDCLVLNVEASDTIALRAALNAYLRWINAILDTLELLGSLQR